MDLFVVECWSNGYPRADRDGEHKDTTRAVITSSLKKAFEFCKNNSAYDGNFNHWHWAIIKEPLDDYTVNACMPQHYTREGFRCNLNGVRRNDSVILWEIREDSEQEFDDDLEEDSEQGCPAEDLGEEDDQEMTNDLLTAEEMRNILDDRSNKFLTDFANKVHKTFISQGFKTVAVSLTKNEEKGLETIIKFISEKGYRVVKRDAGYYEDRPCGDWVDGKLVLSCE